MTSIESIVGGQGSSSTSTNSGRSSFKEWGRDPRLSTTLESAVLSPGECSPALGHANEIITESGSAASSVRSRTQKR